MLIGLRNAMLGGKRLPYDAEVEYVHIPSGGYFDTGYAGIGSRTGGWHGVLRITAWSNTSYDSYWGATYENGSYSFNFRRYNNTAHVYAMTDQPQGGWFPVSLNTWLDVKMNVGTTDRNVYLDNVFKQSVSSQRNVTYPVSVFVGALNYMNHDEVIRPESEFDLKSFKLYDNSLAEPLVRDFIPVRIGSEGAFFDRVTGEVKRNIGTGVFTPYGTSTSSGGV